MDLRSILAAIETAGWDYARVELDGLTIVVSNGETSVEQLATRQIQPPTLTLAASAGEGAGQHLAEEESAPEFAKTESTVDEKEDIGNDLETVISPTIGLFWRSPKPGAPPFVEVGGHVNADDTVCIIEVMKLMTHVKADHAGTVVAVLATNGGTVEFGTPLFKIAAL
jgi:acetyl-CoA carboxylase biotin carboxyl carrier protein